MADTNDFLKQVLAEVSKVSETKANAAELTELKTKAAALEVEIAKGKADVELIQAKAAAELEIIKAALADTHGGKSGAEDWAHDMGVFVRAAFLHEKKNIKTDETFKNGKPAADFVGKTAHTFTTTDATFSGNLLPTILLPGIRELMDIYGRLYPRVTKFTVPPGQSARVNSEGLQPAAAWRATQGGAMTEEAVGATYTTDTLVTQLLYVYQTIANELLVNPSINYGAVAATAGVKACIRKLEYDMLAAASAPSAGVVANSTAQTTMASATFALIGAFIKESIADNAWAVDTTKNCLFLHPRDVITLALQAVGATELTGMLVWGDPRRGIPTTLLGYEVIVHPGCNNGTNNYAFLGDPAAIYLAETGNFGIDFSGEVAFKDFETAMRVYTHADWSVMQPTEWHRAIVTA